MMNRDEYYGAENMVHYKSLMLPPDSNVRRRVHMKVFVLIGAVGMAWCTYSHRQYDLMDCHPRELL